MSKYYSICLDIKDRNCVVVGGGRVAARKVKGLLESHAQVTVISPELSENLQTMANDGLVNWEAKPYEPGDLQGAFLVIAATDDRQVQEQVFGEAESAGQLVNVADVPARCNFILPALVKRGDLTIAVSTAGNSPALAKQLRHSLEGEFGREYEALVKILGMLRPVVMGRGLSQQENEDVFNQLLDSDMIGWLRKRDWPTIECTVKESCKCQIDADILARIKSVALQ